MLFVHVIDNDAQQRAQIGRLLASAEIHIEPFETVEEFLEFGPTSGIVLCSDRGGSISDLVDGLDRGCWLPVIAYCAGPDVANVVRAMQAGVVSYLACPFGPDDFRREYERLESSLAAQIENRQRAVDARNRIEKLSEREREILDCMLEHSTSKEIGRLLGISPRTVEAHRANLMARLDVRTAAQAVRIALEGTILPSMSVGLPSMLAS